MSEERADPQGQASQWRIVLSRTMDVTPGQIWAAWEDPAVIATWWGPAGFRSTVEVLEVRTGGRFDVVMHGPDGTDYPNLYLFDEVVPGRELRYTNQGSAEFGLGPFVSVVDIDPLTPDGTDTRSRRTCVTLTAEYGSMADYRKHVDDFHAVEGADQLLERLEQAAATRSVPEDVS